MDWQKGSKIALFPKEIRVKTPVFTKDLTKSFYFDFFDLFLDLVFLGKKGYFYVSKTAPKHCFDTL